MAMSHFFGIIFSSHQDKDSLDRTGRSRAGIHCKGEGIP